MKVRNLVLVQIMLLIPVLGVSAIGDPPPATQAATQPTTQSAISGSVRGLVVRVDMDQKTLKIVIWDDQNGGFKQNDAGRFQARTLHWSGDTVIKDQGKKKISEIQNGNGLPDIKSPSDLRGWKTEIKFEKGVISEIDLASILLHEKFAFPGPLPDGRRFAGSVEELDSGSDSPDK